MNLINYCSYIFVHMMLELFHRYVSSIPFYRHRAATSGYLWNHIACQYLRVLSSKWIISVFCSYIFVHMILLQFHLDALSTILDRHHVALSGYLWNRIAIHFLWVLSSKWIIFAFYSYIFVHMIL